MAPRTSWPIICWRAAPCDLFLSADSAQVQRLERAGLCQANGAIVVARNGLAIVAPADTTIALRRPHDLLRPEIGRVALADAESPLGRYTREYLRQLGVAESLQERLVVADSSRGVLATLEAGGAGVGLIYTSDAVMSAGMRTVLPAVGGNGSRVLGGSTGERTFSRAGRQIARLPAFGRSWPPFAPVDFSRSGNSRKDLAEFLRILLQILQRVFGGRRECGSIQPGLVWHLLDVACPIFGERHDRRAR